MTRNKISNWTIDLFFCFNLFLEWQSHIDRVSDIRTSTHYHIYLSRRRIKLVFCFSQLKIVNHFQLHSLRYILNSANKYMTVWKQTLTFRRFIISLWLSFQTQMILSISIMIFTEIQIKSYFSTSQKNSQKDSVFLKNYISKFWNRLMIIIYMMILIRHINNFKK